MAYSGVVTTGRLTRQELGWLLAQEARGAAKILRQDVTLLSQPPPTPADLATPIVISDLRVETTLNALDDAIGMLSDLEAGSGGPGSRAPSRRGRIDLAALLWEFAPSASISIEPGAGTEVFGEDGELRRMFHVLVSQTHFGVGPHEGATAAVRIRRQADWIRITVTLGPDVSANTDLERRWLSRMATRMGGHLELEGGTMSLVLPADASNDQSEVADLRKELVQRSSSVRPTRENSRPAFAAGQASEPEIPADRPDVAVRRFELLVALAGAVHRSLSTIFHGLEEDASGSNGGAVHISAGYALVAELGRIAQCPATESADRIDLGRAARDAISESEARASRHDIALAVDAPPELYVQTRPRALSLLFRALVDHAIAATPRGGAVSVTLTADGGGKITVTDGGPVIPAGAHTDVLEHRVDPAALGRPPGFGLLVANTTALYLGGAVRLGESSSGTATTTVQLRAL